jgi:hypothetical protein
VLRFWRTVEVAPANFVMAVTLSRLHCSRSAELAESQLAHQGRSLLFAFVMTDSN